MKRIAGLDVGGANVKGCLIEVVGRRRIRARGNTISHEVWRHPGGIGEAVSRVLEGLVPAGQPDAVGLTMTAELADVFPSKAEGVSQTARAVASVIAPGRLWLWTLPGGFSPAAKPVPPQQVAAANWAASASWLARVLQDGILVDIGSTTTDIIPVGGGRVEGVGLDDTTRLKRGELLYLGMLRTPAHALRGSVFLGGETCRVAHEYFAVMADAYRLLGLITEDEYSPSTPDGRGRSIEACTSRLARVVAADLESLPEGGAQHIAMCLKEVHLHETTLSILQVLSRFTPGNPGVSPLVAAGQGAFLVPEIAGRLGLPCHFWWNLARLEEPLAGGMREPIPLTAYAVADLLAGELEE
ncbi:MAG: hydantoinase/oxoprolinase family protein [Bacillota bacterium]|jgi:probable H4MPT-linked C1 transfer pathway protein